MNSMNLMTANAIQQMFQYEGTEVRVVMINGNPWFVAKDVCDVLAIRNVPDAMSRLNDNERNYVVITDGKRGNPKKNVVNESGLYALISQSRKPEAKAFQYWVNHDVLPSIRKTGSYSIQSQPQFVIPQTYIEALEAHLNSEKKLALVEAEKQILLPKAERYDEFLDADGLTTMTLVGKHFLGGLTANKVAKFLQEKEVLFKKKVDDCYVPRHGYEKYFKQVHYIKRDDYGKPKMLGRCLKFNNEGIDLTISLLKGTLALN